MNRSSPNSINELDMDDGGGVEEMATASLIDVVSSRNRFLEEKELWALCRECCLTLEYVHDCHDLFQSLCISPETVAFDPDGNVCFLDLDVEPESTYVAPELQHHSQKSYKSHLFSLGMTLLYAIQYNKNNSHTQGVLSYSFNELATAMTNKHAEKRPDLDAVITACDKALGQESSQEICLKIIDFQCCSASKTEDGANKDFNDNCLHKTTPELHVKDNTNLEENKHDESHNKTNTNKNEGEAFYMHHQDSDTSKQLEQKQDIALADILNSLGRRLDEVEIWSLCRESVLSLQKKKKHFPAYISPDTVILKDSGTISFKAFPEDKSLEVIYMAPELQQKGVLDDKTCLFGLGITLRSAAGFKYSSNLSIPDGEALEILIKSFTQGQPNKRPDLDTALEMCEEYEKISKTSSQQMCCQLYKEAMKAISSSDRHSIKSVEWRLSTDNDFLDNECAESTHSRIYDKAENVMSTLKSLDNTTVETQDTNVTSAFKQVSARPHAARDQNRVPTAFSSPATHFRPIVLQDAEEKLLSSDNVHSPPCKTAKESDIVSKLKDIEHNLRKHRHPDFINKGFKESEGASLKETKNRKYAENEHSPDLEQSFHNLQGHLPNSDVIASMLALYLTNYLKDSAPKQSSKINAHAPAPSSFTVPTRIDSNLTESSTQTFLSEHSFPVQHQTSQINYLPPKNINHDLQDQSRLATAAPEGSVFSQQIPLSLPCNILSIQENIPSINMSHRGLQNSSGIQVTGAQLSQTSNIFPLSMSSAVVNQGSHSTTHFSGLPPHDLTVKYTLVQDPITGLVQMVPAQYVSVSSIHNSHSSSTADNYLQQKGMNFLPKSGAKLYSPAHFETNQSCREYEKKYFSTYLEKPNSWHNQGQEIDTVHSEIQSRLTETFTDEQSQLSNLGAGSHPQAEGRISNLQFISDSPSKDSGISVGHQSGSLAFMMKKQPTSVNSEMQKIYCSVLRIIQDICAHDAFNGARVKDHVIADYIMSLSSLTWETFCNAVKEKFFHLVWTYEVLNLLFNTIGGQMFSGSRYTTQIQLSPQNKPVQRSSIKTQQQEFYTKYADNTGQQNLSKHHQYDKHEGQLLSNQYQQHRNEKQQPHFQRQQFSQRNHQFSHHHPDQAATADLKHVNKSQIFRTDFQPKSEIRRKEFWSEASDSTDSETRDRKQHFRRHYELDKTKSLSLHNISLCGNATALSEYTDAGVHETATPDNIHTVSGNHYETKLSNNFTQPGAFTVYPDNTSVDIQKSSSSLQSDKHSVNSFIGRNKKLTTDYVNQVQTDKLEGYSSPPTSVTSHSSSSKSGSLHDHKHSTLPFNHENSSTSNQKHQYSQSINNSNCLSGYLPSQPQYILSNHHTSLDLPVKKESLDSGYLQSSVRVNKKTNQSLQQQLENGCDNSLRHKNPVSDHKYNNSLKSNRQDSCEPKRPPPRNNMHVEDQKSQWTKQNRPSDQATKHHCIDSSSDSNFSSSAEVRKLAAQKPALYTDRQHSQFSVPQDKSIKNNSDGAYNLQKLPSNPRHVVDSQNNETSVSQNRPQVSIKNSHPDISDPSRDHNNLPHTQSASKTSHNFSSSRYHIEHEHYQNEPRYQSRKNSRTNTDNIRSFSSIYSQQLHQPETGVTILDPSENDTVLNPQHRRHSEGSVQLPEINTVLLPFVEKGSVVYHSAMVQLSLTAEVDSFIHSIDEENKPAIEHHVASISQEISVYRRQRQKTQKLYKKLTEQSASGKKGDQNVTEQMLKDMTDMTRKLSFLQLCHTHLKMLLAELNGLDSSLLYSLSNCEDSSVLTLQHVANNPYLQFRTLNTSQAEQMNVLQAGTPRGLMSYLYTSSALSNGYIHQFLLCFRYILTADQLLAFILEKYHKAHSNQKDASMICIQHRSLDLLHFWVEGYYSVDFAPNKGLIKKLSNFLADQTNADEEDTNNLIRLVAACRMGENSELIHMTNEDDDDIEEGVYFFHLINPKRWESFRSLLRRSKSRKSNLGSSGSFGKSKPDSKMPVSENAKQSLQFSLLDCSAYALAEQLTLIEQELFRKCHPVHFLNSQFQGVGVALSMPGLRTPSMSRKSEITQSPKKGLFLGDPAIDSYVVHMINHAQELAHWVSAEILSCGSNKAQANVITNFLTTAHLCQDVRNYASALSILDGLENLVVKQLPVWKNIPPKALTYMDELTNIKIKLKSEPLWLMSENDCHIYPTIPCALYMALHLQQAEIGSFTLANGMYKWDKIRTITETVDQIRIFRDHKYGFQPDFEMQQSLHRRFLEYSEQDLHAVASTQDNNFRRHSSSSSLSGTLKRVKHILKKKT